ncbi:DUF2911 domain-containing protein [Tamlana sp. 62-3]|uniref:DUF2911 domain-containing protein n=1 Tax=Neotamlana sargassicola TaxID=2883125 RepID=A0A9X1I298_9FLAO|nr:DUF2911 domain-containing protein [Tamlana sargassicola]MCB4806625.1 DUF2911 domain-containing protein [Tamlana sargassicola]
MKKTTYISALAFVLALVFSIETQAQKFSKLDASPLDIAYLRASRNEKPTAKVIYSRPQLKGRSLEQLAPKGKVWRTGANEAAEIKFYKDVNFGGKPVKAGTYSLFTIPGDNEWTIILSNDTDVWGAYNYKDSKDVVRVKAPVHKGDAVEAFSIAFDAGKMFLAWDTVRVAVPVK